MLSQLEYRPISERIVSSVCYRVQSITAGYEAAVSYTKSLDGDVKTIFDSEPDRTNQSDVSRTLLWKKIFGDTPMPKEEDDAVSKYAGSLGEDLENITDESIAAALAEADE